MDGVSSGVLTVIILCCFFNGSCAIIFVSLLREMSLVVFSVVFRSPLTDPSPVHNV